MADYKTLYEGASNVIRSITKSEAKKNDKIAELEAENKRLVKELEKRYNPYHDPTNGRFTSPNSGKGGVLYVEKGQAGKGIYVLDENKNFGGQVQANRANRLQELVKKGREAEKDKSVGEKSIIKVEGPFEKDKTQDSKKKTTSKEFEKSVLEYHTKRLAELNEIKASIFEEFSKGKISKQDYDTRLKVAQNQIRFSSSLVAKLSVDTRDLISQNYIKSFVIAVDFDGTVARTRFPEILSPIYETINFLQLAKLDGATVILWTCREGENLENAVEWCKRNCVPIDYVNENTPERVDLFGNDSRKISADMYIDDKAFCVEDIADYINCLNL